MAELINLNPINAPLSYPDMLKIQAKAKTSLNTIQNMNIQLMKVVHDMQTIGEKIQKSDNLPDPSTLSREELAKVINNYKDQTIKIMSDTRIQDLNKKAQSIDNDIQNVIIDYCNYGFSGIIPNAKSLAKNIVNIVSSCFHMRESRMRMMGINLPDLLDDYELVFQEVSAIMTNIAQANGWNEYAIQIPVDQNVYDSIFNKKDLSLRYKSWPIDIENIHYNLEYDSKNGTITFTKVSSLTDGDSTIHTIDQISDRNMIKLQAPNDEKTFYITFIPEMK